MQQFQVPQFIEVEDKIFGPLTTKQFFYLLGGGGITFLLYLFIDTFIVFMIFAAPVVALAVSLAFVKVNGRPFLDMVANFFGYISKPRLFLWQKARKQVPKSPEELKGNTVPFPKVSGNRLNDLSWSLDIMKNVKRK